MPWTPSDSPVRWSFGSDRVGSTEAGPEPAIGIEKSLVPVAPRQQVSLGQGRHIVGIEDEEQVGPAARKSGQQGISGRVVPGMMASAEREAGK